MRDEIELLPCPFCGGPAEIFKTEPFLPVQIDPVKFIVGCEQLGCCEGGRPQHTREAAAEFWNRRAPPPTPIEEKKP